MTKLDCWDWSFHEHGLNPLRHARAGTQVSRLIENASSFLTEVNDQRSFWRIMVKTCPSNIFTKFML